MFPKNPFLQLTIPRASKAMERLAGSIWEPVAEVACEFGGVSDQPCDLKAAKAFSYKAVSLPFSWGNLFEHGWFKLSLPKLPAKRRLYLHWQDDGEGTLYQNGVPYYGFDVAHRYAPLPTKPGELLIEGLCLQSGIWHPDAKGLGPAGSRLTATKVVARNEEAWTVYHDISALFDLAMQLGQEEMPHNPPKAWGVGYQAGIDIVSPTFRQVLRALDESVNALDQGGMKLATQTLQHWFKILAGSTERIQATLMGHAHIDLVWLWPERSAEYKTVHTFSTMNRLMESYPEFRFFHSQPACYETVARLSPPLHKAVIKRMESGSWEAGGATYVESDTLMACGEALARSFMIGQEEFCKLQGHPSPVLWIPDVFGYSGCLPQIMQQTGVRSFFTTKLTWSNINRFPYSSFIWKGIDGSKVVVHVTQENSYNQTVSAQELRRGAKAYRQSDLHHEFLAPTGFGDGGGGVTEAMCERARRYQDLAGIPQTAWGRVDEFFERLEKHAADLPVYQGELYLEYHRGVLTTHGSLKSAFRASERALQIWEAARCATGGDEIDPAAWKRVVFAQFHDYIPGSSIWEVYEEAIPELEKIEATALQSASKDLKVTTGSKAKDCLFNPLPLARIHQTPDGGAVRVPPLCGKPVEELDRIPAPKLRISKNRIQSDHVDVAFHRDGTIRSLAFHGVPIPSNGSLAQLVSYPDFPHEFEAWDIDRQSLALGQKVSGPAEVITSESAGDGAMIAFRQKLGTASTVTTRYRVDPYRGVLHIDYDIDWHEHNTLLKAHFPTRFSGQSARFGSPFGSVLRGQQPGRPADEAMFESAASRWAIVSDDGDSHGLGLITESKYGFSCREGNLAVSLIRSPLTTGEDHSHRKIFPTNLRKGQQESKREPHTDQGRHRISIALCAHSPQAQRTDLAPTLAETLFTPLIPYHGEAVSAGLIGIEGGDSLIPCWAKPAKDGQGWILRLHETLGRRGRAKIHLEPGWSATPTNLSETALSTDPITELEFNPYALLSLRMKTL